MPEIRMLLLQEFEGKFDGLVREVADMSAASFGNRGAGQQPDCEMAKIFECVISGRSLPGSFILC